MPDLHATPEPPDSRFELVERHAPLVLVEVDRGGLVLHANARWAAIAGGDRDMLEVVARADRIVVEAALRQAATSSAPVSIDFRIAPADGRATWVRASVIPLRTGARVRSLLLAGIDVSREREADARVERLSAALADARNTLDRIIEATETFPYALEIAADGGVVVKLETPGRGRLVGGSDTVLERLDWQAAVHPDDAATYRERLAGIADGDRFEVEYRVVGVDSVTRWISDSGFVRRRSDGGMLLDGAMRDVTKVRNLEDELMASLTEVQQVNLELELARGEAELLARTDPLTGLANRRSFTETLRRQGAEGPVGLAMLDIDRFKQINDRFGHASGDAVLVEVARRLRDAAPEGATLARVGGEEIVALLPGEADEEAVEAVAERMRRAMAAAPVPAEDGQVIPVTGSFGVAIGHPGDEADAALRAADAALYHAKHTGRNRVVRASTVDLDEPALEDLPEAIRLAQALVHLAGARADDPTVHPSTVAELAARTAAELGASKTEVARCRLAGWLHDIGLASVPDAVLAKAGPLDEREWSLVRDSTAFGERLVRELPAVADAAPGVRHHRERFDGGGYPDGLAGEQIPFEARVIAVVDAYTAMTCERPYRRTLVPGAALAELRRCAGTQFDPTVVDAFCAVVTSDLEAETRAA